MYYSYFGLKEAPFSIAPNPAYIFMTERHQEALAHLYHGIESDAGFVLLTGDIGTGKTTVCRKFLGNLPENTQVAFILNPCIDSVELLQTVCQELQIADVPQDGGIRQLSDCIYQYLLSNHARGVNTVLLIDEAQQIHPNVLEQIRLLTNLETDTQKLLKIILVGQPELNDILSGEGLKQLSQRITARFHIYPLNAQEISAYLDYRLSVAGYAAKEKLFPRSLIKLLFSMSGGVPRLLNVICDRALLGVYAANKQKVNSAILQKAVAEVKGNYSSSSEKKSRLAPVMVSFVVVLAVVAGLWHFSPAVMVRVVSTVVPSQADTPQTVVPNSVTAETVAEPEIIDQVTSGVPEPEIIIEETPIEDIPVVEEVLLVDLLFEEKAEAIADLLDYGLPPALKAELSCEALSSQQWQCDEVAVLNWQEFKAINRPAVLSLVNNQQQTVYGVVVGMTQTHAQLKRGDQILLVPLVSLGEQWTGRFLYLWQAPVGFARYIYTQSPTSQVNWLAQAFAQLDGQDQTLAKDRYNERLKQRVLLFQQEKNIKQDGIAGAQTVLQLNEALARALTLDIVNDQGL